MSGVNLYAGRTGSALVWYKGLISLIRLSVPAQAMVCVIKILVYAFSQVPLGKLMSREVTFSFFSIFACVCRHYFIENLIFSVTKPEVWPLMETNRCCKYLGLVFGK